MMRFLLGATLTLNRTLGPGPSVVLERMLASLAPGLMIAAFSLVLGLTEGFILAALLGRFRNTN